MLRLLTDEHVSPKVAVQAAAKCAGIQILSLQQWREGFHLGSSDACWLTEASRDGLTVVTYDLKTIRPLLKSWVEQGTDHAGVIFVDEKSIPPNDFGALVRALCRLWQSEHRADWRNRIVFLRSA